MDDITRERVWRKLQVLPDNQLFQVLDFIEFLETKYASGKASAPTGLQRFAERLQDRLRGRSVAPEYITGAVGMLGMARRVVETGREVVTGVVQTGLGVVDEVVEAGRELLTEPPPAHPGEATLPAGVTPEHGPAASDTGSSGAGATQDAGQGGASLAADSTPRAGDAIAPPLEPPVPPPGRDAVDGAPGEVPPA